MPSAQTTDLIRISEEEAAPRTRSPEAAAPHAKFREPGGALVAVGIVFVVGLVTVAWLSALVSLVRWLVSAIA